MLDYGFFLSKKYGAVDQWRNIVSRLACFWPIGDERKRGGLVMLLVVLNFALLTALSLVISFPFTYVWMFNIWLIFCLVCIWIGARLEYLLHPERLAYRLVIEAYSQVIPRISDQEMLLDYITQTLHKTLGLTHISIWRYHREANILSLTRFGGGPLHKIVEELPVDVDLTPLAGTCSLDSLPESALRRGLVNLEVKSLTSLNLGQELVGLLCLGHSRLGIRYTSETHHWLELIAGQLTLAVKNVYLIADLEDAFDKLRIAYRRTIDAEEDERRRLAIELHDDILSRLTTMTLTLRNSQKQIAADSTPVKAWLATLEKETHYVNRRLREITQGLHPSVLTDLGVTVALQAYLDTLARQSLPDSAPRLITVTAQGFNGDRFAEPKLERDLYHITRQALDNAVIHAHAEQVFIHLSWRNQMVAITVRDTGQGMADDPEVLMGRDGCLGLLSMRERILAWQGQLNFHTAPGQGTTVHAYIPVDQPSSAPTHLQSFTQYLR